MRAVLCLLLALPLLSAGCLGQDSPAAGDAAPSPTDGIAQSGARGERVELLRTLIVMEGPGPVAFELAVPANVTHVRFTFAEPTEMVMYEGRVELSGCGAFEHGADQVFVGNGAAFGGYVCEAATAGPATVTLTATAATIQGTFVLTGEVPA